MFGSSDCRNSYSSKRGSNKLENGRSLCRKQKGKLGVVCLSDHLSSVCVWKIVNFRKIDFEFQYSTAEVFDFLRGVGGEGVTMGNNNGGRVSWLDGERSQAGEEVCVRTVNYCM